MPRQPCNLTLEERATLVEQEIVRNAVPADVLMHAFVYRHLVPAGEMRVA